MSWLRVAIALGGVGTVAGVAGMSVLIDDHSNYFGVAVALASAGFLTLVACALARVFGSSHGSQDDAFRRGRSMGYDAGFLEGRRTARPVVVPMLRVVGGDQEMPVLAGDQEVTGVARDQEIPVSDTGLSDVKREDGVRFTPALLPVLRREAQDEVFVWDRMVAWMGARRIPLLAGVLSLVLVGVVLAGVAIARPSAPAEASTVPRGSLFDRTVRTHAENPALVRNGVESRTAADPRASIAVATGAFLLAPTKAGLSAVLPGVFARGAAALAAAPSSAYAPISLPGVAVVAPATADPPVVTAPSVVPVVAAQAVPLTAAEQTAADALAAANLTKANAKAAADLTAANAKAAAERTAADAAAAAKLTADNAKAAADLTTANAAAAAAATRQAAADAAWAVAHP